MGRANMVSREPRQSQTMKRSMKRYEADLLDDDGTIDYSLAMQNDRIRYMLQKETVPLSPDLPDPKSVETTDVESGEPVKSPVRKALSSPEVKKIEENEDEEGKPWSNFEE